LNRQYTNDWNKGHGLRRQKTARIGKLGSALAGQRVRCCKPFV
jgi:hypothetical protein